MCSKCGALKHKDEFYMSKTKRGAAIRMRKCKACHTAVAVAWKKANRESENAKRRAPEKTRARRLAKYDLTELEHMALEATAQGHCAICRKFYGEELFIDHDHSTGKVRELLCRRCNSAIGFLGDDPVAAMRAVIYLIRHRETGHG